MPLLLTRKLDGLNEIISVEEGNKHDKGSFPFTEFLRFNSIDNHSFICELAQVLKVPLNKLVEMAKSEKNLITPEAVDNIKYYLERRINGESLKFMQRQHGDAGKKNAPD